MLSDATRLCEAEFGTCSFAREMLFVWLRAWPATAAYVGGIDGAGD